MVINRKKLSNQYLKIYADINGVPDGGQITVTEYMAWIDEKMDQYKMSHKMKADEEIGKEQQKDFISFLWMK